MRALLALALACCATGAQARVASYLPQTGLPRFIAEKFDIASIRSSLGPRRQPGQHHFSDLGIAIASADEQRVVLKSKGWVYTIAVFSVGDINGDGIRDVAVCFSDDGRGAGGRYFAQEPLLLTRYGATGPLIAIAYRMEDDRCRRVP
ncbi:MAG TPA: hypothetical protein VMH86_06380 [Rhizomicrobium sp.]|nr:hypothetical protein [Rhizomicrobium sp.]